MGAILDDLEDLLMGKIRHSAKVTAVFATMIVGVVFSTKKAVHWINTLQITTVCLYLA